MEKKSEVVDFFFSDSDGNAKQIQSQNSRRRKKNEENFIFLIITCFGWPWRSTAAEKRSSIWCLLPRLQNTENPGPSTSKASLAGDGAAVGETAKAIEATGMSILAGLFLFNKGEEGGEEQDGVVEGMGRESMRGSAVEELTLLLLL